ncbi:unnamed protein product [Calypogeia fissa]
MVVRERTRLEGIQRALRRLRVEDPGAGETTWVAPTAALPPAPVGIDSSAQSSSGDIFIYVTLQRNSWMECTM